MIPYRIDGRKGVVEVSVSRCGDIVGIPLIARSSRRPKM